MNASLSGWCPTSNGPGGYSLLRYGDEYEPVYAARHIGGVLTNYVEIVWDMHTDEVVTVDLGTIYPSFSPNDIDNSRGTEAESVFVFDQEFPVQTGELGFAHPFNIESIRAVLELAHYLRNIEAMQRPGRYSGLDYAAWAHEMVIRSEQDL